MPASGRSGSVGIVAGHNVALNSGVIAGLEGQVDFFRYGSSLARVDAVLLGRIGASFGDATLVYVEAGGGIVDDSACYVLCLGIEQAVSDALSVRGEVPASGALGEDMDGGKAKVRLLWRMRLHQL